MKTNPKVSIVIPVYNGEKYMREAIDSALAQTYKNIEVVVVNDGSTDRTDEIARSYGAKIKYLKKKNGGVSTALNMGIRHMSGDFFSWLSHDDVYEAGKVEEEINFLLKNKLLSKDILLYSDYCLIDARSKFLTDVAINHGLVKDKPMYALFRGLINGNTLLIPKRAYEKYGTFDARLRCVQDYDLWFRMSKTYKFAHFPGVTIKSRYHSKQASHTSPLVKSEGDSLWLKMIKSTNKKERIKLNGSEYAFFCQMSRYLRNTPYEKALRYCEGEMGKLVAKNVPQEIFISYSKPGVFSKNKVIGIFQLMRREGVKNALHKVAKRIKKKSDA
ncbi:glycosyltransferase [Candidatus Saccharibacteria bacterium]|nr:glycosyltransferase [Candidatus Saccharibacteria bacterium]